MHQAEKERHLPFPIFHKENLLTKPQHDKMEVLMRKLIPGGVLIVALVLGYQYIPNTSPKPLSPTADQSTLRTTQGRQVIGFCLKNQPPNPAKI